MSNDKEIALEFAKLRAEITTVRASAETARTVLTGIIVALIRSGAISREDAIVCLEQCRGAIADKGSEIIDTDPTVRQTLDLVVDIKNLLHMV